MDENYSFHYQNYVSYHANNDYDATEYRNAILYLSTIENTNVIEQLNLLQQYNADITNYKDSLQTLNTDISNNYSTLITLNALSTVEIESILEANVFMNNSIETIIENSTNALTNSYAPETSIYNSVDAISDFNLVEESTNTVTRTSIATQYRLKDYDAGILNILPPNLPKSFITINGYWNSDRPDWHTSPTQTLNSDVGIGNGWSHPFLYPEDEYINYSSLSYTTSRTTPRTVFFALKISQYSTNSQTISFLGQEGNSSSPCFEVRLINGYIQFNGGTNATLTDTTQRIPLNGWCYVAVMEDGLKNVQIYTTSSSYLSPSLDTFSLAKEQHIPLLQNLDDNIKLIIGTNDNRNANRIGGIIENITLNYFALYERIFSLIDLNNIIGPPNYPQNPLFFQQSFRSDEGFDKIDDFTYTSSRTTPRTYIFAIVSEDNDDNTETVLSLGTSSNGKTFTVKMTKGTSTYDHVSFKGYGSGNDLKLDDDGNITTNMGDNGGDDSSRIRTQYWYYFALVENGEKKITLYQSSTKGRWRTLPYFQKKFEATVPGLQDLEDNQPLYIGIDHGNSHVLRNTELANIAYYEQNFTLTELNSIFEYQFQSVAYQTTSYNISNVLSASNVASDLVNGMTLKLSTITDVEHPLFIDIYSKSLIYSANVSILDVLVTDAINSIDTTTELKNEALVIYDSYIDPSYTTVLDRDREFLLSYNRLLSDEDGTNYNSFLSEMEVDYSQVQDHITNIQIQEQLLNNGFESFKVSFSNASNMEESVMSTIQIFIDNNVYSSVIDNYNSAVTQKFTSLYESQTTIESMLVATQDHHSNSIAIGTNMRTNIDTVESYILHLNILRTLITTVTSLIDETTVLKNEANASYDNIYQLYYDGVLYVEDDFNSNYSDFLLEDMNNNYTQLNVYIDDIETNIQDISIIQKNFNISFSNASNIKSSIYTRIQTLVDYNVGNSVFDGYVLLVDQYFTTLYANQSSFESDLIIAQERRSNSIEIGSDMNTRITNFKITSINITDTYSNIVTNIYINQLENEYVVNDTNFFFSNYDVLVSTYSRTLESVRLGLKTNINGNEAPIHFISDKKYTTINAYFTLDTSNRLYINWYHDDITQYYNVVIDEVPYVVSSPNNSKEITNLNEDKQQIYVSKYDVFNRYKASDSFVFERIPVIDISDFEIDASTTNTYMYSKQLFTNVSYNQNISVKVSIIEPSIYANIYILYENHKYSENKILLDLSMFSFSTFFTIEISISLQINISNSIADLKYVYPTTQYLLYHDVPRIESKYSYPSKYIQNIIEPIKIFIFDDNQQVGYIRSHEYTILQLTNTKQQYNIELSASDPYSEDRDPFDITTDTSLVTKTINVYGIDLLFETSPEMFANNSAKEQKLQSIAYGRLRIHPNNTTYTNHMCKIENIEGYEYFIISQFDPYDVHGLFRLEELSYSASYGIRYRGSKNVTANERDIVIDNNPVNIKWYCEFINSTDFVLKTEDFRVISIDSTLVGTEQQLSLYLIGGDDDEKHNYEDVVFYIFYGSGYAIQFRTSLSGYVYTLNVSDSIVYLEKSNLLVTFWKIDWIHQNENNEMVKLNGLSDTGTLVYLNIKYQDDRYLKYNAYEEYYLSAGLYNSITTSDVNLNLFNIEFGGVSLFPSTPTNFSFEYNTEPAIIKFHTDDADIHTIIIYNVSLDVQVPFHREIKRFPVNRNMYSVANSTRSYTIVDELQDIKKFIVEMASTSVLRLGLKTLRNQIYFSKNLATINTIEIQPTIVDQSNIYSYAWDHSLTDFFNMLAVTST